MSALRMSSQNTDFDAAQALLDLHSPLKTETPAPYLWHTPKNGNDIEKTAKLFWNCFVPPDIPTPSRDNRTKHHINFISESNVPTALRPRCDNLTDSIPRFWHNYKQTNTNKIDGHLSSNDNLAQYAISNRSNSTSYPNIHRNEKNRKQTRDIETQTEALYFTPNIELMENTIKSLCEKIQSLEAQLKSSEEHTKLDNGNFECSDEESYNEVANESGDSEYDVNFDKDDIYKSCNKGSSSYTQYGNSILNLGKRGKAEHRGVMVKHYSNSNDLVPIGDGNASVPSRILKHINWNSYTSATRKLLTAVFSRRILATHSLTGKPSPAFPNKPAKKKLNPALVNDIVQTVVERCSVPENVVRTSITTKCADESKMLRTRQKNRFRCTKSKKDIENLPPTTSESVSEDE